MLLRAGIVMAVMLLTSCAEPAPETASCQEIAHDLADVVIEAAQAMARTFAAEMSEAPALAATPPPAAASQGTDAFATAEALARGTPQEAGVNARVDELAELAAERDCGPEGWETPILTADLEAELQQRTTAMDGEPSTEEYVSANLIATLLVTLDGSLPSEAP